MLFLGCLGFFNLVLYWCGFLLRLCIRCAHPLCVLPLTALHGALRPGMFVANAAGWEEWQAPDEDVRRVLLISMGTLLTLLLPTDSLRSLP